MLVISCAAPFGAVFAQEESDAVVSRQIVGEGDGQMETAQEEVPSQSQGDVSEESASATRPEANEKVADVPSIENNIPSTQVTTRQTQPIPSDIVQPTPPELPDSPLIITAYKASGAHLHAVQLYNNSSVMQSLEGFELLFTAGDTEYPITLPDGWLQPRSYMVLAWQGESIWADGEYVLPVDTHNGAAQEILLMRNGNKPVTVPIPSAYDGSLMHRFKSSAGNYTTNITFSVGAGTMLSGGLYMLPDTPEITVLEVLVNPKHCVVGQETKECYDYLKIKNTGTAPIDLSLYRLRSGYGNASSSATNTAYLAGVISAGEWTTITHDSEGKRLTFTANDGTVWLEDRYGYATFDLAVPPYIGSDKAAQVGKSWSYNHDTGVWQWGTPSPLSEKNEFAEIVNMNVSTGTPTRTLVPCRDDQYRSEETNRCRSIVSARVVTPCREGQYRNEATNRCRSIAVAANALKPCADDQFRNPETNRCKKIASSDDVALADCGEGRERNPLTNRCRNIQRSVPPVADFAVEPIRDSTSVFVGWWILGGVAFVAVSYAGWEWREEIGRLIRKVFRPSKSIK